MSVYHLLPSSHTLRTDRGADLLLHPAQQLAKFYLMWSSQVAMINMLTDQALSHWEEKYWLTWTGLAGDMRQ